MRAYLKKNQAIDKIIAKEKEKKLIFRRIPLLLFLKPKGFNLVDFVECGEN